MISNKEFDNFAVHPAHFIRGPQIGIALSIKMWQMKTKWWGVKYWRK